MEKSQVIAKLETDPFFCLGFAIDNNPQGVVVALQNNGYAVPNNTDAKALKLFLLETLKGILISDKSKAIEIVSQVPYIKDVPIDSYTYGLYDYFARTQPAATVTGSQRFSLDALLGGLGAGLSTYASVSTSTGTIAPLTAIQLKAEADAKAKADADKRKRNNYYIIGGVIVVVIFGVIFYMSTKKKS